MKTTRRGHGSALVEDEKRRVQLQAELDQLNANAVGTAVLELEIATERLFELGWDKKKIVEQVKTHILGTYSE